MERKDLNKIKNKPKSTYDKGFDKIKEIEELCT
jgi:hypothetical protein